jgi:hypothetical protein
LLGDPKNNQALRFNQVGAPNPVGARVKKMIGDLACHRVRDVKQQDPEDGDYPKEELIPDTVKTAWNAYGSRPRMS